MSSQLHHDTAVVIGGSMAGLVTARVLSEYFARVVILERDVLPEAAEQRKGVPQGRHAHALLGQGKNILQQLFPGLTESLTAQGAPLGLGRFFSGGGYFVLHPEAPAILLCSRPCLEAEVRRRVRSLPNVEVVAGCNVHGFTQSSDRRRITGIRFTRQAASGVVEALPAALVVDASGRGSRTPAWLEALGYTPPDVELVDVGIGYATRIYERKPDDLDGDLLINVAPTAENRRACGMLAQENNRWIVTLAGYFGELPPIDEQGFLAFARQLPTPDVYDFLQSATPLTDAVRYTFPSNQRRRYERLRAFPACLLVIGDAMCSFTPIYGQGMSVVAMEAMVLRECLAEGHHDLARRYFRRASRVIDNPWSLTVGNDRRLGGAPQTRSQRLLNVYMSRLQLVARHDPEVSLAFGRVGNLLAAPPSLMHPRIALRVLRGSLFPRPAKHATGLGSPQRRPLSRLGSS